MNYPQNTTFTYLKVLGSVILYTYQIPTIYFIIKIVKFIFYSDDKHPLNMDLKTHFRICQVNLENLKNLLHTHGLTTPTIIPIEIHVKCLNSTGRFYFLLPSPLSSVAYHNES